MTRTLLTLLLLTTAHAGEILLAWDASPTTGATNILYVHTSPITNLATVFHRANVGTNCAVTMRTMPVGQWYFAVTAKLGVESAPVFLSVEVPASVSQLREIKQP